MILFTTRIRKTKPNRNWREKSWLVFTRNSPFTLHSHRIWLPCITSKLNKSFYGHFNNATLLLYHIPASTYFDSVSLSSMSLSLSFSILFLSSSLFRFYFSISFLLCFSANRFVFIWTMFKVNSDLFFLRRVFFMLLFKVIIFSHFFV